MQKPFVCFVYCIVIDSLVLLVILLAYSILLFANFSMKNICQDYKQPERTEQTEISPC
jgi:hypothetical protein